MKPSTPARGARTPPPRPFRDQKRRWLSATNGNRAESLHGDRLVTCPARFGCNGYVLTVTVVLEFEVMAELTYQILLFFLPLNPQDLTIPFPDFMFECLHYMEFCMVFREFQNV